VTGIKRLAFRPHATVLEEELDERHTPSHAQAADVEHVPELAASVVG
jgi:hypothetical protein